MKFQLWCLINKLIRFNWVWYFIKPINPSSIFYANMTVFMKFYQTVNIKKNIILRLDSRLNLYLKMLSKFVKTPTRLMENKLLLFYNIRINVWKEWKNMRLTSKIGVLNSFHHQSFLMKNSVIKFSLSFLYLSRRALLKLLEYK